MATMATMASLLLNGERAVVLLLTVRILLSTPFSLLLLEAVSLSLLAFVALFVEISLEFSGSSCDFRTRLGASSGILLGAVTLPTVMLSKLIQQSRGMPFDEVAFSEFQYQRLLYWDTYMCCFIVLMFLGLAIRYSSSSKLVLNFSFMSLILCAMVYFMVSANGSTFGVYFTIFWTLGHGVSAVKLIQHILCTFPSCASMGEALLVTAGLTTYFGDIFGSTLLKVVRLLASPEVINVQYNVKRSEIGTIIQCYLLGLLLLPLLFKVVVQVADHFISSNAHVERSRKDMIRSVLFFTSLVVGSTLIIPLWVQFVQDFQVHPLFWVITFVFSEPHKRLSLCIYWIAVICVSIYRFYNISKSSKVERILLRKYYHLMAVSMFVPALILQPSFLNLAFGVALAAFLIFEIIRVWRIWPLGEMIHQFMSAFTDHRDSELLIVSHFSLLLGCALPMWMSSGFNDRPLVPFAGILSLGIGDTMASMVGHKYGVLRWSKISKKTIEGTAAGITSVLVACTFLLPLLASTGYIQNWSSLLIAVIASGLLEAYTTQLDNAFIPLAFYSLLCV